jgi:hypothetical protein
MNEIEKLSEPIAQPARPREPITGLAALPGKTLIDERALALIFNVTARTIRRMVARRELPPPVPLAGRSTWVVERLIAHIEARAERAARKAEQEARRIEALRYPAPRRSESLHQILEGKPAAVSEGGQ